MSIQIWKAGHAALLLVLMLIALNSVAAEEYDPATAWSEEFLAIW